MTKQHPITPPPELVEQWLSEHYGTPTEERKRLIGGLATEAARWGADQELESCCAWLAQSTSEPYINALRIARRPKPPSRKEQALEAIGRLCASVIHDDLKDDAAIVRRALEALDD